MLVLTNGILTTCETQICYVAVTLRLAARDHAVAATGDLMGADQADGGPRNCQNKSLLYLCHFCDDFENRTY